jgi:hypothetical protein
MRILLAHLAVAFLASAAPANDRFHVFYGNPIAIAGSTLVFADPVNGLELTVFQDVRIEWKLGRPVFSIGYEAETTTFIGFLDKSVKIFTKSGSGNHSALYLSTGLVLAKLKSSSFTAEEKITSTWTDNTGTEHQLTSTRKTGERYEAWVKRHEAMLDAFQRVLPPKKT